jgi:hypothetical protein
LLQFLRAPIRRTQTGGIRDIMKNSVFLSLFNLRYYFGFWNIFDEF